MSKIRHLGILILTIAVLSSCADTTNLEQALQVAQKEANTLSTRVAEQEIEAEREISALGTASADAANVASTRAAGVLAEAQGAAEEAVSAAEATSEAIAAAATLSALPDINYDTSIYGVIDELDMNGIVVKWWHNSSGQEEAAIQNIIADFNESNQFGILVEATNEGDLDVIYDKMLTGLSTGDVPSVLLATQGQMAEYQKFQGLVNLDPYFEHPLYGLSQAEKDDLFDAFLQADRLPQFENQLFGFPINREMELLYYNQDWLEELGFDGPPRDLSEFEEMACAAADSSANGETGFSLRTDGRSLAAYAFASGHDIYDYEEDSFSYNTPGTVEYLLGMRDLVDRGCAQITEERFADQTAFGNRSALFIQGSSLNLPFIKLAVEENEEPFNWSVGPIPYVGFEPAQIVHGSSLAIPETSPEEQLAAWIFVRFLSQPAQQARWVRASDGFPIQGSTAFALESYFEENPVYRSAFELLKYGRFEVSVSGYDQILSEAALAYSDILDGEDPELNLSQLDGLANSIIVQ